MNPIDDTHHPDLRSWVTSANAEGSDFPIQNLPFGCFSTEDDPEPRPGVAIGDSILDLRRAGLVDTADMNVLMAAPAAERRALRAALSQGLAEGSVHQAQWTHALVPQADATMHLPCHIGDYTDFYAGIHHATAVGKLFRPDQPLMPNYKWVPIGYHGRASSIGISGETVRRPRGQTKAPDADQPSFGPSARLDFELELGFLIGPGNAQGAPIAMADAEEHLFGVTLLNDWSARDLQAWEYQPLGPFLSKNFASTLSPWMITFEALAPFRAPLERPAGDPQPLPYLDSPANRSHGALCITLETWLQTAAMRATGQPAVRLTSGNTEQAAYWSAAQLVAHHTVNGCNLQPGDLLGSGTLSGPDPTQAGSLLELTQGGKQAITLPNGETRTFLQDGDTLTLRGYCEREGAVRIGLGAVTGTIVAA